MAEAVKLDRLIIEEVSGVDAPANLLDGWMVCKQRGNELALLDAYAGLDAVAKIEKNVRRSRSPAPAPSRRGPERVAKSGIRVWVSPELRDTSMVTHVDAPTIRLRLNGVDHVIQKATADPELLALIDPDWKPAEKAHHSSQQMREPESGRWRTSLFRRAVNAQPKLSGARFFTG